MKRHTERSVCSSRSGIQTRLADLRGSSDGSMNV